jgi:glycine betaine catabolism B
MYFVLTQNIPAKPLDMRHKLLEKIPYSGTDLMSFKFSRSNEQNINNSLNYKAGQYANVDLGTTEDPEGPVRSFSLASSPTEEDGILFTTRIRNTPFKQKLANLDLGTAVKITYPMGEFVLHDDYSKPAVFLSGGIGVTPFRSMIKYATDKQLPLKIIMLDSNRNKENILYREEFDAWQNLNRNLKIVNTLALEQHPQGEKEEGEKSDKSNKWDGEIGRINKDMILRHLAPDDIVTAVFYICGPPAMLNAMENILTKEMSITKGRIRQEEFYGY